MASTLIHDRELFDCLRRHPGMRRLRGSFDFLLGHPVWWLSFKTGDGQKAFRGFLEASHEIWHDPRLRGQFAHQVFGAVKKRSRDLKPYVFRAPSNVAGWCMPLVHGERVIGYFGVSGIPKDTRAEVLSLLACHVELIVESCSKAEELKRLSATVRPRAIALSTVHTVHRIINSTLNLDELISRLAHLTAQVLRSNRCAIYLVEKPKTGVESLPGRPPKRPSALLCRAMVGYPRNRDKRERIAFGSAAEGRVAKTARTILRRKFLCLPLIDEDVIGVITVSIKKDGKEFTHFDQEILTTLAEEAVIAIKNAQLYEEQKKVTLGTIQSLAVILGTRVNNVVSPEAILRVALKVAEELHLGEEDTQALHYATLLKDTAKIGIPDEILRKPTKLTGEEYQLLRDHPIKGAKIVQSFESLQPVVPFILYSREKYDGSGYPKGLKGEGIPIGARILAVISAFEAIVMGRPYRDRASLEEALAELLKNAGTQFDPKVVEVFVRVVKREGSAKLFKETV